MEGGKDKLLQIAYNSDIFSFSSAWHVLRTPSSFVEWHNLVQHPGHVPNVSCCLYRANHNRLKTRDNLNFEIDMDHLRSLRGEESENGNSLFRSHSH